MRKPFVFAAILSVSLIYVACPASAALVGYWNFNETSGTVAHNQVPGGPDGALLGGAHFVSNAGTSLSGNSVRLDHATGDLIDFGDNYNFTGSFSVVVWVRIAAGDTTPMIPISKYESTGAANGYFVGVGKVSGGQANPSDGYAQFVESGSTSNQLSHTVNDNSWYMLVGVYRNETPATSLYIPGYGGVGPRSSNAYVATGASFVAGGFTTSGVHVNQFTGNIDEVRLYDTALDPSQAASIYAATVPEPDGTLTAFLFALAGSALQRR